MGGGKRDTKNYQNSKSKILKGLRGNIWVVWSCHRPVAYVKKCIYMLPGRFGRKLYGAPITHEKTLRAATIYL